MSLGPWTIFNRRMEDMPIVAMDSGGDTFKMTLHTATQALSASFVGGSGNATYADLTNELSTASGYTNGGATMTSVAHTRSTNIETWTSDYVEWTLSSSINVRYAVIRDSTTGLLICFCDLDAALGAGVNQTVSNGFLRLSPSANGWIKWETV